MLSSELRLLSVPAVEVTRCSHESGHVYIKKAHRDLWQRHLLWASSAFELVAINTIEKQPTVTKEAKKIFEYFFSVSVINPNYT